MKIAFVLQSLPALGYHGGAMTCWAIAKEMRARRHDVTVISLYDVSTANPYLASRQKQTEELASLGIPVRFLEFNLNEFHQTSRWVKYKDSIHLLLGTNHAMRRLFPWMLLAKPLDEVLQKLSFDVIFVYHFDALAAIYHNSSVRKVAGVGDLWDQPMYFQWSARRASLRKWTVDLLFLWAQMRVAKKAMRDMLRSCQACGAFAAHYADWIREAIGIQTAEYWRTPVADVLGAEWKEKKERSEQTMPTVVMIGDLYTTSTSSGWPFVIKHLIPRLDQEFGPHGYQVRLVGAARENIGGSPLVLDAMKVHPAFKHLGRVVPADSEILKAHVMVVPTPIPLGIRVRIITGLSLGTVIVTHKANCCGIPELKDNDNCLVGEDNQSLADKVVQALKDRPLRKRLEKAARALYESRFSEAVAAGRIVGVMENLGDAVKNSLSFDNESATKNWS